MCLYGTEKQSTRIEFVIVHIAAGVTDAFGCLINVRLGDEKFSWLIIEKTNKPSTRPELLSSCVIRTQRPRVVNHVADCFVTGPKSVRGQWWRGGWQHTHTTHTHTQHARTHANIYAVRPIQKRRWVRSTLNLKHRWAPHVPFAFAVAATTAGLAAVVVRVVGEKITEAC